MNWESRVDDRSSEVDFRVGHVFDSDQLDLQVVGVIRLLQVDNDLAFDFRARHTPKLVVLKLDRYLTP